jgi:predicted acyl esterase
VRFASRTPETIEPSGGDPNVGKAIDPVAGGGDACATTSAADQSGTATYRLPVSKGYTLLGAPTIVARLKVTGDAVAAQVAGRLWDVAPGGASQTLVARGEYRPRGAAKGEVWQLHANGWRFKRGHTPKLELLGSSPPSSRPSNGQFQVIVERLQLRLPTRNKPDCRVVLPAAAPVLSPGQRLAPGVSRKAARGCRHRRRSRHSA